jgi:pre-mRNA-processing factor 17
MVRDVCFSNDGKRFLSAGFDKYIKLWDTETGQCITRFTNKKIPYCVKFNPNEDLQHLFLAGCSDKKIIQWDVNTGKIVQEYDQHLGAVNTITFIDNNRRFVSTSDDKSLRVWEWNIPVVIKLVAEPHMHSMPAVTAHPSRKCSLCCVLHWMVPGFFVSLLIYFILFYYFLFRKMGGLPIVGQSDLDLQLAGQV